MEIIFRSAHRRSAVRQLQPQPGGPVEVADRLRYRERSRWEIRNLF